jgi:hypothetical protein
VTRPPDRRHQGAASLYTVVSLHGVYTSGVFTRCLHQWGEPASLSLYMLYMLGPPVFLGSDARVPRDPCSRGEGDAEELRFFLRTHGMRSQRLDGVPCGVSRPGCGLQAVCRRSAGALSMAGTLLVPP